MNIVCCVLGGFGKCNEEDGNLRSSRRSYGRGMSMEDSRANPLTAKV